MSVSDFADENDIRMLGHSNSDDLVRRPWTPQVAASSFSQNVRIWIHGTFVFTVQEDQLLLKLVNEDGLIRWCDIALYFQNRTGKQCSERQVKSHQESV